MMSLSILNNEFFSRNPPLICIRVVCVVTGKGTVAALEVKNDMYDIYIYRFQKANLHLD